MGKVSCIYCIVHKLDKDMENIYIGSTKDLCDRKCQHKSRCNHETKYNNKLYQYIRDNGGIENFEFIILEECEVEKLKRLEQSYMDVYKPSLNSKNADGLDIERRREGMKEWRQTNKEHIMEKGKEYRQKNKEHIKENCKEWYEKNKEHIKEHSKEYYEENKEHMKEYSKEYRQKNKERVNEKFDCECGGKFIRKNKAKHKKTTRHQRYLEQNNNISTV
jgi:membrane-bound lytic murein transglycosylase